jgi:hypothetical protein
MFTFEGNAFAATTKMLGSTANVVAFGYHN